jgi:hypothetical protein
MGLYSPSFLPIYGVNVHYLATEVSMAQTDFFTETTIYNYRLMKRIPHTLYNMVIYIAIVLLLLAKDISEGTWWLFIISYPLAWLMHSVVIWIYFYFTVGGAMRGWSFHWGLFWNGILPEGYSLGPKSTAASALDWAYPYRQFISMDRLHAVDESCLVSSLDGSSSLHRFLKIPAFSKKRAHSH